MGHIGSVGRTAVCTELDWIWTEVVVVLFLSYCLRIYMELVKITNKISVKVACLWIWSQICDFLMIKQVCGTFHHDIW
jgi:hypothetical protein